MSDYEVGYGKPPKDRRFKIGNSANLKGRPKRRVPEAGDIIDGVLNAPAQYREQGRTKSATRRELTIRTYIRRALEGDAKSAEALLRLRAHAQRFGDAGIHRIRVKDWLPDYPKQTGEQKTRELAAQGKADNPGWWESANIDPTSEGR